MTEVRTAAGRELLRSFEGADEQFTRVVVTLGIVRIEDEAAASARLESPTYEERVQQMAHALHEDCVLTWQGLAIVDPNRQINLHTDVHHWGQAHSLVRRIFGDPGR
jgi:hypothetical protein